MENQKNPINEDKYQNLLSEISKNLNQNFLIIGPECSGKSRLVKDLTKNKKTVWINGLMLKKILSFHPFLFSDCREQTEYVCFDDFNKAEYFIDILMSFATNGIRVNIQHEKPIHINPNIIIISNDFNLEKYYRNASFNRRYKLINTNCLVNI